MLKRSIILMSLIVLACSFCEAQQLKPGFDASEYKELILVSARTSANPTYFNQFPEPAKFRKLYQSPVMGLDNLWDFWSNNEGIAVISIRGTTQKMESWLANFYAAMVPAKVHFVLALPIVSIINWQKTQEQQFISGGCWRQPIFQKIYCQN